MDERSSRVFFGLCMLVLVWIGVYWMWQPTHEQEPTITFDRLPGGEVDSQPRAMDEDEAQAADFSVVSGRGPGGDAVDDEPVSEPINESVVEPIVAPVLIPPEFTEHVVEPGELMQTIAKRYYGSIDEWAVIAKANPGVDPQKLKPGMVLRIPVDRTNIQGKLVGVETHPGVIRSHTPSDSKVIEYMVQSGDSLSVISQRIYGSSRYARFIYESNRDILRSMDSISIGQVLKLPPLPGEDGQASPGG